MAVAGVPFADGRLRLRHQRLPRRRPALRQPRRPGRVDRRPARPRDQAGAGHRGQPHLRRAPVVPELPRARLGQARLVLLGAAASRVRAGDEGRRADQRRLRLRGARLGVRPGVRRVLPAPVQPQAAGPQLGESGRPRRRLRHDALVGRPRRRRVPDGRDQLHLQGAPDRRRPGRGGRPVLRPGPGGQRPADPRVPGRAEPRGRDQRRRPVQRRRDGRGQRRSRSST